MKPSIGHKLSNLNAIPCLGPFSNGHEYIVHINPTELWIYSPNVNFFQLVIFKSEQRLQVCTCPEGLFTNYVTHFLLFFDHPPTHSNTLAIILLMTYNTRVCYSNTFANHPPTPAALRNMWMAPYRSRSWCKLTFGLVKSCSTLIASLTLLLHYAPIW